MAASHQAATLPPAQPFAILRGHVSPIHSVQFVRQNSRLLTGDADGWIVYWKVETKRPLAVWKAHNGPILGVVEWGHEKIITHGKDNTLRIWQLRHQDELGTLSTTLPKDAKEEDNPKPWLLHALPVNTLNFCSFSMCYQHPRQKVVQTMIERMKDGFSKSSVPASDSILVAVPATDDKMIDVYRFPGEQLKVKIPRAQPIETGMVMALKLVRHQTSQTLLLLAGYEGGVTAAFMLPGNCTGFAVEAAQLIYLSQPHSQPVLSLDVLPEGDFYFTSSADAIIAMHQIPNLSAKQRKNDLSKAQQHEDDDTPLNSKQQAHQGEEEAVEEPLSVLSVIQDEEMLDRPPDTQQIPRSGSLAASSSLSFAKRPVWKTRSRPSELSRLSSILFSSKPLPSDQPAPSIPSVDTPQPPYKIKNTGHAGQQSLHVRSDGRLLITGGWDTRTRIYSSRTLKEVAMLKWHKKGVYAVAFNDILTEGELGSLENEKARLRRALLKIEQQLATKSEGPIPSSEVQQWFNVLSTAMDEDYLMFNMILGTAERERWAAEIFSDVIETYKVDDSNRDREFKTKLSHYVAAGDKDGKVSLWEMF